MNTPDYATKEFWDDRFKSQEKSFDWYVGWKELKDKFISLINHDDKILMVGCGNSKLSESMYAENFTNITNIDISSIVIQQMKELYAESYKDMVFLEMDATLMDFPDNTFDIVIDKGTLDALMCSKNDEVPKRLINEMFRVTKKDKFFSIITYGSPDIRLELFMSALPAYSYELSCHKVALSLLSNFVNSLRNNSSDFSIKSAIKDKDVLYESFIEVCLGQLESKKEQILQGETLKETLEEVEKKIKHLKIMRLLIKGRKAKENFDRKNEEKLKDEDKINLNLNENENNNEKSESGEKNMLEDDNTNVEEKEEVPKKPAKARQNHCYLYIFKKKI